MKSRVIIASLLLLIVGCIALRFLIFKLDSMGYETLSSKRSQDALYLITEMQSMIDGSHASYGNYLVLSRSEVNLPDQGYVIYGGYCETLAYFWESDSEITISCDDSGKAEVKTLAVAAYGIRIKYK